MLYNFVKIVNDFYTNFGIDFKFLTIYYKLENIQMNLENNITLKIKYHSQNKEEILNYIKNYNNVVKFTYNRLLENGNLKTKEITVLQKSMNNIFIDSHFKNSAIFDSKALIKRNENNKIIFGGKKLFLERTNGKISKEEYEIQKLIPLFSVGESLYKGNRKFSIIDDNCILFKSTRNEHFILELESIGKNYKTYLNKLIKLQDNKKTPITYKLDTEYIYITFDLNELKNTDKKEEKVKDRYFSIDMNPNYVGYTIIDWKSSEEYKVIDKGVISLKKLNDYDNSLKGKGFSSDSKERKYVSNKRNYEVIDISHKLVKIAEHFKCEYFVMEDLSIPSKNNGKGKKFNKLCNQQWCRNVFVNQIKKMCKLNDIGILEVIPNYSSFIGNMIYRKENLPDFVLSSIEISRRGYEFNHQYILKDKEQKKNIVYGNFDEDRLIYSQSLEEIGINIGFSSFQELYDKIKNSKTRYRVSLDDLKESRVFSKFNIKSRQTLYKFI